MAYCPECGAEVNPKARFCEECGVELDSVRAGKHAPDEEETAVLSVSDDASETVPIAPVEPPEGAGEEADAHEAGGDDDEEAPTGSPAAPTADEGVFARLRARKWPIPVALAGIVVVGALAGFLGWYFSREPAPPPVTFKQRAASVLSPVRGAQEAVEEHLDLTAAKVSDRTLTRKLTKSAKALEQEVTAALDKVAAFKPLDPKERTARRRLAAALKAHLEFAAACAQVPKALKEVEKSECASIRKWAGQTDSRYNAALKRLPGVADVSVSVAACDHFAAAAAKARKDAALRSFLVKIDNQILHQSANGRDEIIAAVAGVENMTMDPSEASRMVDGVVLNRQSLLQQLTAMTVPDDDRAVQAFDLLQESLHHSIEGDRYFSLWMIEVYNYYYQEPQGYLGHVPRNDDYERAVRECGLATDAKQRFCAAWNKLAARYDLKSTWQHTEI